MSRPFEEIRDEIVNATTSSPYKIVKRGKSLSMHNHEQPCSIAPAEINYLINFIRDNKLKRGYEVATAFGISAWAIGRGMKEHGGRLVSMDAYIEEQSNSCVGYGVNDRSTYQNSDGFKTATFLMEKFDLKDIVNLVVGFSPTDTPSVIKNTFGDQKLDFVFIDALHLDAAVLRDTEAILPFLEDKCAVFFHDVHCFSDRTKNRIAQMLGKPMKIVPGCEHPGDGFNLALVNKL